MRPKHALLYLLYAAVIIGLTAVIIIDFASSPSPKPKPPTQTAPAQPKQPAPPKSSPPSSSGQSNSSTPNQPAPSTPLANSGPGDVAAVFAAGVLVGTVSYSYYQRRKVALS